MDLRIENGTDGMESNGGGCMAAWQFGRKGTVLTVLYVFFLLPFLASQFVSGLEDETARYYSLRGGLRSYNVGDES